MIDIFEWLNSNKEWVFSGIGCTIIAIAISLFLTKRASHSTKKSNNQVQKTGKNSISVQIGRDLTITSTRENGEDAK